MGDLALSALRLSVPLIFAALGGLMSERSGVANLALEASLLVAAFTAAAVTALSGNLWFGAVCGVGASGLVAALFAAVCVWGRGDQIVIGTAFNLLAIGVIPVLTKSIFDVTGSTPSLGHELTFHGAWAFFALALTSVAIVQFVLNRTRHGLRIRAAGDHPAALRNQGVNPRSVRWRAVAEGGILTGIGGVYLSLCQGSGYVREMSAGRGYIALAALIFGAWRPWPTLLACLFFAFTDAVQMQLQGQLIAGYAVPNSIVQILPFVVTLTAMAVFARTIRAPAAINQDV